MLGVKLGQQVERGVLEDGEGNHFIIQLLFEMAKYHSPSVIFFDEIDCIGSKRS